MNITSRLELIAETQPAKPAFIFFSPRNKRWDIVTYKQLSDSTQRLTRGLQACRAETGMRAALMTPPSADFFALAFALLKLGIVPIIPRPCPHI
jgi:2,3-dihydroxybenzoate-AMP ligase